MRKWLVIILFGLAGCQSDQLFVCEVELEYCKALCADVHNSLLNYSEGCHREN